MGGKKRLWEGVESVTGEKKDVIVSWARPNFVCSVTIGSKADSPKLP